MQLCADRGRQSIDKCFIFYIKNNKSAFTGKTGNIESGFKPISFWFDTALHFTLLHTMNNSKNETP